MHTVLMQLSKTAQSGISLSRVSCFWLGK